MFKLIIYFSIFSLLLVELTSQTVTDSSGNQIRVQTILTIDSPDSGSEFIPAQDFYHAGMRRYLPDGSLPFNTTKIKPIPSIILGTALTGIFITQHLLQQSTIWKDVDDFHIQEDWKWTWGLDKLGHFYGAYASSYFLGELLMISGFGYDDAFVLGGLLGVGYLSYIEILDGKSKSFGFSPTDFYADVAGGLFYTAQHFIPVLQNFSPKFMYLHPPWLGYKDRKEKESFIDNYSTQVFWISVNVNNLLPESMNSIWPSWLELSFGYAVYSLCQDGSPGTPCYEWSGEYMNDGTWGRKRLLIGLDYNLAKLLPEGGDFWNWIKQGLNLFRLLPAPVLEIGKETKFYLAFPFKIEIGNLKF